MFGYVLVRCFSGMQVKSLLSCQPDSDVRIYCHDVVHMMIQQFIDGQVGIYGSSFGEMSLN